MSVADIPAAPPATGFARRHAWLGGARPRRGAVHRRRAHLVATQNPNLVPATILLGAAVVPAAFVAFISGRRLPYASGAPCSATAFLGGVIGIVVAGTLEFDAGRDLGTLPMLGVGLIEETSKLIIPLAVLLLLPACAPGPTGCCSGSPRVRASPRWRRWGTPSRR